MRRLRLVIVAATLMAALFMGSGIASAGVGWCDWGSPPPMDAGIAPLVDSNPNGMPTPIFQNKNGKFDPNPVVSGALLPPGMSNATK